MTEVFDQSVVMQLQIVDEYLNHKFGSKVKTYELPLTENQQKVKAVKIAIKALTPTSKTYLADIQKAAELYNTLDADFGFWDQEKHDFKDRELVNLLMQ